MQNVELLWMFCLVGPQVSYTWLTCTAALICSCMFLQTGRGPEGQERHTPRQWRRGWWWCQKGENGDCWKIYLHQNQILVLYLKVKHFNSYPFTFYVSLDTVGLFISYLFYFILRVHNEHVMQPLELLLLCFLAGVAVVCSCYLQGEDAPRPHSRSDDGWEGQTEVGLFYTVGSSVCALLYGFHLFGLFCCSGIGACSACSWGRYRNLNRSQTCPQKRWGNESLRKNGWSASVLLWFLNYIIIVGWEWDQYLYSFHF